MLINNVEKLREYLGRAVNASFEPTSLLPFVKMAQDTYIQNAIGKDYLAFLETTGLNTLNEAMKIMVERALALYAYEKYLPYALGNDGDGGLHEPENMNTKPLRIGVLEKRERATSKNASEAIEAVLFTLYSFKSNYPEFWNSSFGQNLSKKWFKNAHELNEVFPQLNIDYRILLTLNPYFDSVAETMLNDILGDALMNQVIAVRENTNTNPNIHLKTLYVHAKRYIAVTGYEEALTFLQIQQTPKGLRVYSEFDGINNSKAPDTKQYEEYKRKISVLSSSAKNTLIGYLNQNIDNFPDFKNSYLYREDKKRGPQNKKYKTIFRMS
jgi:disulfide oxidoreductase YuzD